MPTEIRFKAAGQARRTDYESRTLPAASKRGEKFELASLVKLHPLFYFREARASRRFVSPACLEALGNAKAT
jgi:hypothetical protein